MIYTQERDRLRQFWCDAWRKACADEPLEPLEQIIANIVASHTEYHALLTDPDGSAHRDWQTSGYETNPFLHLGMHLALQESIATDRPLGVRGVYHTLMKRVGDAHRVEHQLMECLAETLWQAQRYGGQPDERAYLACLQRMVKAKAP